MLIIRFLLNFGDKVLKIINVQVRLVANVSWTNRSFIILKTPNHGETFFNKVKGDIN